MLSTPRRRRESSTVSLDVLGPAVQAGAAVAVEGEPELGGENHLIAYRASALPTSSSLVNGP